VQKEKKSSTQRSGAGWVKGEVFISKEKKLAPHSLAAGQPWEESTRNHQGADGKAVPSTWAEKGANRTRQQNRTKNRAWPHKEGVDGLVLIHSYRTLSEAEKGK